jgi:hypothetical protein
MIRSPQPKRRRSKYVVGKVHTDVPVALIKGWLTWINTIVIKIYFEKLIKFLEYLAAKKKRIGQIK